MRAKFYILFLILLGVGVARCQSLPDHCAILPVSQGPALIKQCSRGSPTNVTGFWSPSPDQIVAIEKLLPALLSKSGHKLELSDSYRQYVGVTSNGKKLIYLNSFPKDAFAGSSEHVDWRTQAVVACDGGPAFWGVEFDPADNTFHNFGSNGIG
jgi:hypothetical protein